MAEDFNKNDKQRFFNQIKGSLQEKNIGDVWCSITISAGHEGQRSVNLAMKKALYDEVMGNFKVGDRVNIQFYLTSRFKNERWYTVANVLQIDAIV